LVVLDDDPTGTQTVYGLPVVTDWRVETLISALSEDAPALFILTNSRSLPVLEARAMNREIARNVNAAAAEIGCQVALVSRSDSTLRGHFPAEVEALEAELGPAVDGWLIIPFFLEGGRYTIDDVHYVAEGDALIPAAETPFAQDAVFGYRSSNLRQWVEEKTVGRVAAQDVISISLDDMRNGGPDAVARILGAVSGGQVCVVNAAAYRDMEVFVLGLLQAEEAGKRFLYRTAASFVRTRAGLDARPLLSAAEMVGDGTGGGLIVVGSYVPKTTDQVKALLDQGEAAGLEISVEALLDDDRQEEEIGRVVTATDELLLAGRDVVLFTSRRLVTVEAADENLAIGRRISASLVRIVGEIGVRPRYLLAKGGITSSDLATQALGIRRATVLGQILPGVPVWRAGPESRYPGLGYIVFPGNVGGTDALVAARARLQG
jgi:uncharacterized protein YgbK (DUF1537 family)